MAAAHQAAKKWNESNPVGTLVIYRPRHPLCDVGMVQTRTRSEAWALGCGIAVVSVEDISGGVDLDRCMVVKGGDAR
ncbi:MAG: hypothetical protein LBV12_08810 [Puniceicoccales bacterium]|nr:hypothetical protein [Puniceicoccales bacterium]